jgi:hypothetical protein
VDHLRGALQLQGVALDPGGIEANNFFKRAALNPLYPYDVTYSESYATRDLSGNYWNVFEDPDLSDVATYLLEQKMVCDGAACFSLALEPAFLKNPVSPLGLFVADIAADGHSLDEGFPLQPDGDPVALTIRFSQAFNCAVSEAPRLSMRRQDLALFVELPSMDPLGWLPGEGNPPAGAYLNGPAWLATYDLSGLAQGVYELKIELDDPGQCEGFPVSDRGRFFMTIAAAGGVSRSTSATKNLMKEDKTGPGRGMGIWPPVQKIATKQGPWLQTNDDEGGRGPNGSAAVPVQLIWPVEAGETFHVYRSREPGTLGRRINGALLSDGRFWDFNPVPGSDYYYTVAPRGKALLPQIAVPGREPDPDWAIGTPIAVTQGDLVTITQPANGLSTLAQAYLFQREPAAADFTWSVMTRAGSSFSWTTPARSLDYYVLVVDGDVYDRSTTPEFPHRYTP